MTYFSPDYIKRRSSTGGGVSPEDVLEIIRDRVRVPYFEPVIAMDEIVIADNGDIVMSEVGTLSLIELP